MTEANTYLAGAADDTSTAVCLRAADMLCELAGVMGIELRAPRRQTTSPRSLLTSRASTPATRATPPPRAAGALLAARQEARAQKMWATADAIRDGITALGLVVEDTASGARLHRKE